MVKRSKQYVPVSEFTREYVKIAVFEVFAVFSVSYALSWVTVEILGGFGGIPAILSLCASGSMAIFSAHRIEYAVEKWIAQMLVVTEEDDTKQRVINENPHAHIYAVQDSEEDVPFEVNLTWAEIRGLINAAMHRTYLTRDSLEGYGISNLSRKWQKGHFKYAAMSLGLVDKNMRFVVGGSVVPEVDNE